MPMAPHKRPSKKTVNSKSDRANAEPMVALLRGINVGGRKPVPMAELRQLAARLGFTEVTTYIQSGNLVFMSDLDPPAAERAIEQAIVDHFEFPVDVVVRTQRQWEAYAAKSPFRDAEREHPHLLLLGLTKLPVKPGASTALQPYATAGERFRVLKDAIWIDYATSIATTKVSPAVLDRAIGSTVTARNWRTVQKLAELLRAIASTRRTVEVTTH